MSDFPGAPTDWDETDRWLDELLDLDENKRSVRLRELARSRPQLAGRLRSVLAEDTAPHQIEDRFRRLLVERLTAAGVDGSPRPLPETIGAYRIRRLLGEGGMGTVYLAERADGAFEQTVALKVLSRGLTDAMRRRFVQERQMLARLQHPRIARLLDGGLTAEGEPYFAMDYVEGVAIDHYCNERRATTDERLALFDQVLDAVSFAHQNLVLHRDLKPANILVTADGAVKLLDFGIAKLLAEEADTALTQTGDRWLTPDFASPEQIAGEPVSTASDVYSLGILLFELLTGGRPFAGHTTRLERQTAILEGNVPRASASLVTRAATDRATRHKALVAELRGDLDAIVSKALRREPEARYASVEQLRADLVNYRTGYPVQAARGNWLYAVGKLWRRHRVGVAGAILVVTSLAVGLGVALRQAGLAREAEAKASAINRFLTEELLGSASPDIAQGRDLTVAEVLETAERNLGALAGRPEVEASIRRTLAHVHVRLGNHDRAHAQIEAARGILTAMGGPGADTAAVGRIEAELALAETDLDVAKAYAEEAVAVAQEVLGPNAPATLESRMLLGQIQSARYETIEAEVTLRDVIGRIEGDQPEAMRLRLAAKQRLAQVLARQTRRNEALDLLREILDLQQQMLGAHHPEVANTRWEMSRSLSRLRFYDEAEEQARAALAIQQRVFGDAHPETQRARYELGRVFLRSRRGEEALPFFEQVLALAPASLGDRDLAVVDATNAMAVHYARRGERERSVAYYQQALGAAETVLGPVHDTTAMIRRNLSNELMRAQRPDEAVEVALEVRRLALETANEPWVDPMYLANNVWFLWSCEAEEARDLDAALILARTAVERSGGRLYYPLISLQDVYYARGELAEAIAAGRQALELQDALHLAGAEHHLMKMLLEAGDLDGAEGFLRGHLARRQASPRADPTLAGHTRALLGRVLMQRDRFDEARGELEEGLVLFEDPQDDAVQWAARARSDLGALLARGGDLEAARASLSSAVAGLERAPSDPRQDWESEHRLALGRLVDVLEQLGRNAEAAARRAQLATVSS